jgi:hypothetical protein
MVALNNSTVENSVRRNFRRKSKDLIKRESYGNSSAQKFSMRRPTSAITGIDKDGDNLIIALKCNYITRVLLHSALSL